MSEDDGIPTLDQVVRPGNERSTGGGGQGRKSDTAALSDAEIEAIVTRVMDRYNEVLRRNIERAIRQALKRKEAQQKE